MLNRSFLTAIIGFLVGCLAYFTIEASIIIVLIMGGVGYFLGLILDNADIKHQLETFHFSSIPATQEIFQSDDIPEALIIYSPKENLTTVSIDFRVETKPQDFRLSVLKNLHEHQFRVLEDTHKTIFSLTLDYPDCNYSKLLSSINQKKEFHFDIHERSLDFQNAVQKIVPGLILSQVSYPDLYGEEISRSTDSHSRPSPPSSSSIKPFSHPFNFSKKDSIVRNGHPDPPRYKNVDRKSVSKELIDYPPSPELGTIDKTKMDFQNHKKSPQGSIKHTSENSDEAIDESEILEDLLANSPIEPRVPDLSPEDVQQLKNHNERRLEVFLNEESSESTPPSLISADKLASVDQENNSLGVTNESKVAGNEQSIIENTVDNKSEGAKSVKIDYTNLNHSSVEKTKLDGFNLDIVSRIEERTKDAIDKIKTNPELQKEMGKIRKNFDSETATEESSS